MIKLENGIVAIQQVNRSYLIAVFGSKDTAPGLIRGRLEALCNYFSHVFDQVK